jgi:hypothetical protein
MFSLSFFHWFCVIRTKDFSHKQDWRILFFAYPPEFKVQRLTKYKLQKGFSSFHGKGSIFGPILCRLFLQEFLQGKEGGNVSSLQLKCKKLSLTSFVVFS